MRWLYGINNSVDISLSRLKEIVKDCVLQSMRSQIVKHDLATEQKQMT